MRLVMKFGGSCFKSAETFRETLKRVQEHKEDEIVVVTSALYGVTNKVLDIANGLSQGESRDIEEFMLEIRQLHFNRIDELIRKDEIKDKVKKMLEMELGRLKNMLGGIFSLKELTPKTKDHVMSFGERLSTPIFYGLLLDSGLKAEYFTGMKLGIVTDDSYNSARPILELTQENIKKNLNPLLKDKVIPVVTGFIAQNVDGVVTTLGRGGSDLTATLIGAFTGVDEVWLWKDVDGFMTTDPKIEKKAKLIPSLTYEEAIELSYFGSKVIQVHAVEPAMHAGVPIRIKNFSNPDGKGTIIQVQDKSSPGVKAVSMWKDVALIEIRGSQKIKPLEIVSHVFNVMAREDIETVMFSQGSREENLSVLVRQDLVNKTVRALNTLKERSEINDINYTKDICTIAVVGKRMRSTAGVAGTIFNALGHSKINVAVLARGSSDYTLAFAVKESDGEPAVRVIHEAFKLGK